MDGRHYRADIDGLRAIAIMLVVAYHGGWTTFGGGFVGVDVFFVLSGYLITGLLVAEYQRDGRISLREFYARRARRLLPVAALVLIVTMVAGLWLVAPLRRAGMLADAASSAMYVANWRFAAQSTAYVDTALTDSLFLHFWSLSVEEQFYLLWPLLIVGVGWLVRRRWPHRFVPVLGVALTVLVAASLLASVTMTYQLGPRAYYATPMRLWEMGMGAALALVAPKLRLPRLGVASAVATLGLAAIAWSAMTYDANTLFPGTAALVPVAGTILLIWSANAGPTAVSRMLSARPLVGLGRLSYGWYLWHWPALGIGALLHERGATTLPLPVVSAAAIAVSLLLAALSLRLVENPIRYSQALRVPRRSLALGVGLTLSPVAVGLALFAGTSDGADTVVQPRPVAMAAEEGTAAADAPAGADGAATDASLIRRIDRMGTAGVARSGGAVRVAVAGEDPRSRGRAAELRRLRAERLAASALMTPRDAADDRVTMLTDGCHNGDPTDQRDLSCAVGDLDAEVTVALIGDSHAQHWLPALDAAGRERGWRVVAWTMRACAPFDVALWDGRLGRRYHECEAWNQHVLDRLAAEGDIDLLLLGRVYGYEGRVLDAADRRLSEHQSAPLWTDGAVRTFERHLEHATRVKVLRETPRPAVDVPECLAGSPGDPSACEVSLADAVGMDARLHAAEIEAARLVAPDRVGHLDPSQLVCDEDPCQMVTPGGVILFRDSHHLTQTYSRLLGPELAVLVDEALPPHLSSAHPRDGAGPGAQRCTAASSARRPEDVVVDRRVVTSDLTPTRWCRAASR